MEPRYRKQVIGPVETLNWKLQVCILLLQSQKSIFFLDKRELLSFGNLFKPSTPKIPLNYNYYFMKPLPHVRLAKKLIRSDINSAEIEVHCNSKNFIFRFSQTRINEI